MKPAIEIKNLGKEYTIAAKQQYLSLRESVTYTLKNIFTEKNKKEKFWALQDINLSIEPGERVGIIGRNGAGKSTLLKIISQITPPTQGEVILRGRVGSLLEVGTGFHPELSGRENIFLNGAILGLKRKEIIKKLDAIIDFSGVEKFIDTPLKHYSSGMQMRLAFAVAAHLEPEILLIDEVLAVGDAEFQKKCIGKMEEVSKEHGRTILFVSHDMVNISQLCQKVVLLDNGKKAEIGKPDEIINRYISQFYLTQQEKQEDYGDIAFINLSFINSEGIPQINFNADEIIGIKMKYEVKKEGMILWQGYNVINESGINVFDTHSVTNEFYYKPHNRGIFISIAWVPANLLNTGTYFIGCAVFNHSKGQIYFHKKNESVFTVEESKSSNNAKGMSAGKFSGVIRPMLNWDIKQLS